MPAVRGEVLLCGGQLGPNLLTLGSGLPASLLWQCTVPEHLISLHESIPGGHAPRSCLLVKEALRLKMMELYQGQDVLDLTRARQSL